MDGERRRRGDLQRDVLTTLAEAGRPLTAAEVRQRLGGGLAYTTVMTVLTRLSAKGLIDRSRAARSYVYRASTDPSEVTARRMQRLLDADRDRAAVLTRFVGALSEEDEQLLIALLRDADGNRPT
jgi:predicted transcriptional regulator